ncbi:unnamed protein product [Phaedon cochleariae]|uniref:PID domain-containing protein n=1 Tax=Phaedon cochleariae TaxID=80249 RepID=A0A9N9X022_PHACE|nr:unnamed protein product [Phaedon cochleariae]
MAFFKAIWKPSSKHEKLSEELALQNSKMETEPNENFSCENDVVTFKLKYLGSTVVEKKAENSITTEAVKNILKTTKAAKGRKKLQRVNVMISLQGIEVTDMQGNYVLKISIYRISNCSTDPTHRQIFSFSSTDENDITECHAFLCSRRKTAETVTLAVGHAFNAVYEVCRLGSESPQVDFQKLEIVENEDRMNINLHPREDVIISRDDEDVDERLISFDDDEPVLAAEEDLFSFDTPLLRNNVQTHWVCFDDDFISGTPSKTAQTSEMVMV